MKNDNIIFDLYLTGKDGESPGMNDISEVEKLLSQTFEFEKLKKKLKEKNYGRGADWPVLFIEWLNNDYLSATLNFLSIVVIGKNILNLVTTKKEKPNAILLGPKSASYVGFYYLDKNFPGKEFTLMSSIEIDRGNFEFRKEFVIIFKEKNDGLENDLQISANEDISVFGKLAVIHLDWYGNLKALNIY